MGGSACDDILHSKCNYWKLEKHFCSAGLPQTVVTDNGPSFVSEEFEQFLAKNGIRHQTSSAYQLDSNVLVERSVQSLKLALKKKQESWSLKQKSFETPPSIPYNTTFKHKMHPSQNITWPSNTHQVHVTKPDIGEKVGRSIKNEKYNMTGEQ